MPSSIAFDFISILAVAFFGTFFGLCGWFLANGMRLLELPKDPGARFLAGLVLILLLYAVANNTWKEQDIVLMIASFAFVGFCLRSFYEFGVRDHEKDLAFSRALSERSMSQTSRQTTNLVV